MLLIDNEEAELLEGDVLREEAMGGDNQVDLAASKGRDDLRLTSMGDAPREEFEAEGVGGEAAAEGLDVLEGEHGCWHEHGHLAPRLEGGEGGAKGNLGLPVPHIAHDHPVHRAWSRKVALHRLNGGELVGGFAIREGGLELGEPRAPRLQRCAVRQLARRVDAQQLIGKIIGRLLGALFRATPLATAKPAELRMIRSGVARDARKLLYRNEDTITAAIFNLQIVTRVIGTATANHLDECADSVVDMHKVITRRQSLCRFARDATSVHRCASNARCAKELSVGDDRQPVDTTLKSTIESSSKHLQ